MKFYRKRAGIGRQELSDPQYRLQKILDLGRAHIQTSSTFGPSTADPLTLALIPDPIPCHPT